MSLPNILRNDHWGKEAFNSFVQILTRFNKEGITEYTFTKENTKKYNKVGLSDIGEEGQIIEYASGKLGKWKVTNVLYQDDKPIEVSIKKINESEISETRRMGEIEIYNQVSKVSYGKLKTGIIVLNNSGSAYFVREITTTEELDKEASYNDELNNPLRKKINKEVIVVKYSKEISPYDYDDGVNDTDYIKHHDGNGFQKEIREEELDKFMNGAAITSFTSLIELRQKVASIQNGEPIEELQNVVDDEKSSALVSTSNKDFLKSVEASVDNRRNAAAVIESCLNRIVKLKKEELDHILNKQKEALMQLHEEANRVIAIFKKQLKKIQRLITTLEIYLGIHENVMQISEGEPADSKEPIHLYQQLKYMDEEFGDPTDQGLDYSKIDQWDSWMIDNRNFEKIIPTPRGICIMHVRRFHKDRGNMHPTLKRKFEKLDERTYVVIRNGDNVYRIWSGNIEIPKRMFPKRTEVQDMLDEMQKDINRRTNKDEAAEEANEKVDDYIFNYKRVMLMVQGILYRTEIFVPLPIGLDLFKPETHKDKVVFVYDDELSLPSGRLSFRGWHKQINSTIVKGSRVLLGRGDLDSDSIGERSMTRDRFVIYFREGNNPPGPENDVYSVEEYTTEETEYVLRTVNRAEYLEELAKVVASTNKDYKDALLDSHGKKAELKFSSKWEEVPEHISMQYQRDWDIPDDIKLMYTFYDLYTWKENGPRTHQTCDNGKWSTRTYTSWDKVTHKVTKRFLCIRYNPGDTVYAGWGKRFEDGNGYSRERKVPLTWLIDKYDGFLLNYDRISLDDIEFYINSRIDRKNYVRTLPLLYTIRKKLIAEMEWEQKFIAFTETEIKKEINIDVDLKPLIQKAIDWWKLDAARVWKRPITEDDTKALVMIKQETKRLIKKELGYKIDSGVDNTKKILIFKYGGVVFVCKGLTKKQFLDGLVRQDALQSSMQITWRKKTPDLTKASIGRMITETTSGVYSDLIEKKGEKRIIQAK